MGHSRQEAVEPKVRRIDRALACEQKQVVEEPSKGAAAERCDHRDPEAAGH